MSTSPRVISLDIETYGAAATNGTGTLLPQQTVFHPARAIATDGVARQDLVLTCAITVAAAEPPPANVPGSWNLDGVATDPT